MVIRRRVRAVTADDPRAERLESMLDGDRHQHCLPVLSEAEALAVVDLLEYLIGQSVGDRTVDVARTLIVRILDRLDHPPGLAGGEAK